MSPGPATACADRRAGPGHVVDMLPDAADMALLPPAFRLLAPRPIYGRAPDATPGGGMNEAAPHAGQDGGHASIGTIGDLGEVMLIMDAAFDPRFGEAWTRSQCVGILALPGVWLTLARRGGKPAGFALARVDRRRSRTAAARGAARTAPRAASAPRCSATVVSGARSARRDSAASGDAGGQSDAGRFMPQPAFGEVGRRIDYYRGKDGRSFDAITLACPLDQQAMSES